MYCGRKVKTFILKESCEFENVLVDIVNSFTEYFPVELVKNKWGLQDELLRVIHLNFPNEKFSLEIDFDSVPVRARVIRIPKLFNVISEWGGTFDA